METKYQLKGGGTITAASPEDAIIKLRELSFNPCDTPHEFMREVAEQCYVQNEAEISFANAEIFIDDLIENEFLKVVE